MLNKRTVLMPVTVLLLLTIAGCRFFESPEPAAVPSGPTRDIIAEIFPTATSLATPTSVLDDPTRSDLLNDTPTPLAEEGTEEPAESVSEAQAPATPVAPVPTLDASSFNAVDAPFDINCNASAGETFGTTGINILACEPAIQFSPYILGGNLPAWLGPERFTDEEFIERTNATGITMIRIPGGSWSNWYDWLACERAGLGIDANAECNWPWAATPSDYLRFFESVDRSVMYTARASNGGTSKEAAAAVAFFNGDPSDTTVIGFDIRGRDWGTVGQWAQLRVDQGFPEPLGIEYWEVGNEFYGGKAGLGTDCQDNGWETVWTCDGVEYVYGIEGEDGFIDYVREMKAVDPDIRIGAIGLANQNGYANWGNEVIAEAADFMDFYVIHEYGFDQPPENELTLLARPFDMWPAIMEDYQLSLDRFAGGKEIPVAVTEYNLFSFQAADTSQMMTRLMNAMYITDSIGQMIQSGVEMAHHWDISNGVAVSSSGTDYGLVHDKTFDPNPQYYAFPLWSQFGTTMYEVQHPYDPRTELSVYAGKVDNETVSLLVVNKTYDSVEVDLRINGESMFRSGEAYILQGNDWWDTEVFYNGVSLPASDLSDAPPTEIGTANQYTFEPLSITLLHLSRDP